MKTVFGIFRNDIKSIVKHFFVLVIVIAIVILPALYAWVNIYANSNPYVNTGNIPVAVASYDPGAELSDGTYLNAASDVMKELKEDDNIGWEFPDTPEKAIEGVRSGKYYAAIVFEDNFSYNMANLKEALKYDKPAITYYSNTKKNAVAAKITDTAANELLERINTKYLEEVFGQIFEGTNRLSDELDSDEAVDKALKQLRETRDALADLNASIGLLTESSGDIQSMLSNAQKNLDSARSHTKSNLSNAQASIKDAKKAIKKLSKSLKQELAKLDTALNKLDKIIGDLIDATDDEVIQELRQAAIEQAEVTLGVLKDIRALIPDTSTSPAARMVCDTVDIMILHTEEVIQILNDDPLSNAKALSEAVRTLLNIHSGDLVTGIDSMISDFKRAIRIAKPLLGAAGGMLDNIDPILETTSGTVVGLDNTTARLQVVLSSLDDQLTDTINKVEAAEKKDRLGVLTKLLGGDPDEYSQFFSSLIDVNKHEVYSVKFYGAAMTPFYTILALWVGGVILAALLNTNVNRRKYPQITESQGFFGRFLIFFLIGQLQAVVVVLGDIFLLGVSPVHPWLMWFAAAVASMVFVMFIYSIVLSFGIVGKAFVVVVMVLQIAGSSGTYPIDILPIIFDKIYKFFPFPYAINAMREGLCGTYGYDILIYLGQLMIFAVIGILIGLFVRRPFIGVNRFITKKLEETEVL